MLKRLIAVFILPLLTSGCIIADPNSRPRQRDDAITIVRESYNTFPQIIQWNDFGTYNVGTHVWIDEAKKRFKDPIVFHCHGGVHEETTENGGITTTRREWWCYPDYPRKPMSMNTLAETLANMYPDRDIILITCNPGGFDLKVPRVWYAKVSVWTVPDDNAYGLYIHETMPNFFYVGTIWEFQSFGLPAVPAPKPVATPPYPFYPASQPTTVPSTRPAALPSSRPITRPSTQPVKAAGKVQSHDLIVPTRH